MAKFKWLTVVALVFVLVMGCIKPPDYPDEPRIGYIGVNQNTIAQGNGNSPADTLAVLFSFTDGDGDLGTTTDSIDVFLTDSRDGFTNNFKLPVIPEQGLGNGISGEITIRIPNKPFNICCTYPDGADACLPNPSYPIDTFSYGIRIRDRAGRMSNLVQTEKITILCN